VLARVVEHVIDELKGDAEPLSETAKSLLIRGAGAGDARAVTRGPAEQRRGLVAQNSFVGGFGDVELATTTQLYDLALDQTPQRRDQIRHRLGRVPGRAIERVYQQQITGQHAHAVAPSESRRRRTSPLHTFVDHVVVQQRRGMHELRHDRELAGLFVDAAETGGTQQQRDRPHALATAADQVPGGVGPRRGAIRNRAGQRSLNPPQVIGEKLLDVLDPAL